MDFFFYDYYLLLFSLPRALLHARVGALYCCNVRALVFFLSAFACGVAGCRVAFSAVFWALPDGPCVVVRYRVSWFHDREL